jgi:large subunit ribosomal protein L9
LLRRTSDKIGGILSFYVVNHIRYEIERGVFYMEVVLKQDYEKLGKAMDVVTVKDGYARNFLIPTGVAVPATEGNKKTVAEARRTYDKREEKTLKESRHQATQIEKVPCTIPVKVVDDNKIFGSVGVQEISEFLKKEGFNIEKRAIELSDPIRELGVYTIVIKLHKEVTANLKVWVVKEEASA